MIYLHLEEDVGDVEATQASIEAITVKLQVSTHAYSLVSRWPFERLGMEREDITKHSRVAGIGP